MIRTLDAAKGSSKAAALRASFSKLIVGQTVAVDALVGIVEKHQSGMYDMTRPIGSLLELGPTGTGKTAVAEAFVMGLGGDERNLMKIDCGEYQHSHEIAKLVGSPPGYLGHRETSPFFTNDSVKKAKTNYKGLGPELPFTVILWDEIEKASDALWALLLGVLDKARLTTGTNEIVDMSQTVHILTSNVGASDMSAEQEIGFMAGRREVTDKKLEDIAKSAARKKFMPEFLNRLDYTVMFKTLTEGDLNEILGMQLQIIQDRIVLSSKVPFDFNVAPAGLRQLIVEGFDRRYNARELKRTIEKYVFLPLSRMVSSNQIWSNDTVIVDYKDGEWKYISVSAPLRIGAANGQK